MEEYTVKYHGVDDLNNKGFPYYTQWGYSRPIISLDNLVSSTMVKLTEDQILEFERYEKVNPELTWFDVHKRILEINEELEKICTHCSGQGQVTHDGYMPPTTCKPCKGTGRV